MKQLTYIVLFLLVGFMACQKEPNFPDPKLDSTRDVQDTVRRDTADYYKFVMHVNAPNGINQIQVLNGRNYEVLEVFEAEYAGKKDFDFVYSIDLRNITKDTSLYYVIKVIDNNLRTYNKGFSLLVREYSKPMITVAGAKDRLGISNPSLSLRVLFETGLKDMKSYTISFEGKTLVTREIKDTVIHSFIYEGIHDLTMEKGKEYTLRFELTDATGQSTTKDVKVTLIEAKRPVTIIKSKISSGKPDKSDKRYMLFKYNPQNPNLLDAIEGTQQSIRISSQGYDSTVYYPFTYNFTYTDFGKVETMSIVWKDNVRPSLKWMYQYDQNNRIIRCEDEEDPSLYQVVREYLPDGKVKTVQIAASETNKWSWEYVLNTQKEPIFADYLLYVSNWDKNKRQIATGLTTWMIPTYLEALPAIVPSQCNVLANPEIRDLFLCKQGFSKVMQGATVVYNITYFSNEQGQLQRMRFMDAKNSNGYEYTFFYE